MQYKIYDIITGSPITHTMFTGKDLEYIISDLKNKGYKPELKKNGIYIDKISSIYDIEHYANTKNICESMKNFRNQGFGYRMICFDEF